MIWVPDKSNLPKQRHLSHSAHAWRETRLLPPLGYNTWNATWTKISLGKLLIESAFSFQALQSLVCEMFFFFFLRGCLFRLPRSSKIHGSVESTHSFGCWPSNSVMREGYTVQFSDPKKAKSKFQVCKEHSR